MKIITVKRGERAGWKYVDDDWFRHWYLPGVSDQDILDGWNGPASSENHEMCLAGKCRYYPLHDCKWHPEGCRCSAGACQGGFSSKHRFGR